MTITISKPEVVLKFEGPAPSTLSEKIRRIETLGCLDAVRCQMQTTTGNVAISIFFGNLTDLTQPNVDAIVCPQRPNFRFTGSPVQSAIAIKSGISTFYEAETQAGALSRVVNEPGGGLPLGYAIVTKPGRLNLKSIIHAVNTTSDTVECDINMGTIRSSVIGALKVADKNGLNSIAFPSEGAGRWALSLDTLLKGTVIGTADYLSNQTLTNIEKVAVVLPYNSCTDQEKLVETAKYVAKTLAENILFLRK
jgi:O-acetyl-ADP-ribose deacetylase (regulator of RNase III)